MRSMVQPRIEPAPDHITAGHANDGVEHTYKQVLAGRDVKANQRQYQHVGAEVDSEADQHIDTGLYQAANSCLVHDSTSTNSPAALNV